MLHRSVVIAFLCAVRLSGSVPARIVVISTLGMGLWVGRESAFQISGSGVRPFFRRLLAITVSLRLLQPLRAGFVDPNQCFPDRPVRARLESENH